MKVDPPHLLGEMAQDGGARLRSTDGLHVDLDLVCDELMEQWGDATTPWDAHTFSDVTPFSLRWELSRGSDAGRCWETLKTREFHRTALEARKPMLRDFAPPQIVPGRCDDPGFRYYEDLIGRLGAGGATFEVSSVLDRLKRETAPFQRITRPAP